MGKYAPPLTPRRTQLMSCGEKKEEKGNKKEKQCERKGKKEEIDISRDGGYTYHFGVGRGEGAGNTGFEPACVFSPYRCSF
jgi:hypothetical protein